jgi:hypothetical protein
VRWGVRVCCVSAGVVGQEKTGVLLRAWACWPQSYITRTRWIAPASEAENQRRLPVRLLMFFAECMCMRRRRTRLHGMPRISARVIKVVEVVELVAEATEHSNSTWSAVRT